MRMVRAPSDSPWWFLYEGTVGGRWSPETHYWGTDRGGPRHERPDSRHKLFDRWRWAYFGDKASRRLLFIGQKQPDALPDTLWYMGAQNQGDITSSDGMIVFGFGRGENTTPQLRGAVHEFVLGLLDARVNNQSDHERVQREIESHLLTSSSSGAPRWEAAPRQQEQGVFWRYHWYERGIEAGNPGFEKRFRVNSPEVSLHPIFGKRVEARENGMMLILAEEDLALIRSAEFYGEVWGGHPGSANKRVTVNGRSTYYLPRVGTEEGHCTYHYPSLTLNISDLVSGYNAFQFAIDQGTTFWGHMIVDNAALRVALVDDHPVLTEAGIKGFHAWVRVDPLLTQRGSTFRLFVLPSMLGTSQAWISRAGITVTTKTGICDGPTGMALPRTDWRPPYWGAMKPRLLRLTGTLRYCPSKREWR